MFGVGKLKILKICLLSFPVWGRDCHRVVAPLCRNLRLPYEISWKPDWYLTTTSWCCGRLPRADYLISVDDYLKLWCCGRLPQHNYQRKLVQLRCKKHSTTFLSSDRLSALVPLTLWSSTARSRMFKASGTWSLTESCAIVAIAIFKKKTKSYYKIKRNKQT